MAARMKGHNQLPGLLVHLSQFLIMVIWYFGRREVRRRAEFSFFPHFLKGIYRSWIIPLSPGRQHAFPWHPPTSLAFPLFLQCSRRRQQRWGNARKWDSMHSHQKFSQVIPVLRLERLGMDPAHSAGAAHTYVPSDSHLHSSLNSAQNLFALRHALPEDTGPPIYLLTWIKDPPSTPQAEFQV